MPNHRKVRAMTNREIAGELSRESRWGLSESYREALLDEQHRRSTEITCCDSARVTGGAYHSPACDHA